MLFGFNTQPPEGGWASCCAIKERCKKFQHTAARRRLGINSQSSLSIGKFQHTAARRRLEFSHRRGFIIKQVSTHSRPKAAGARVHWFIQGPHVSTHSRPKAAGASLKSLAPSGFAAPISLSSQEKREHEYNTAFSVTPTFAIS